jgi:hypothetical protein
MFWTLGKVLGQAYSADVHYSWVRLFSSVIRVIIPIAVHHELMDSSAQKNRFEKQFENDFGEDYVEGRCPVSNRNAPSAFDVPSKKTGNQISNHVSAHSSTQNSAHNSNHASAENQDGEKKAIQELNTEGK